MIDVDFYYPSGSLFTSDAAVDLTIERAEWTFSSLRIVELSPGGTHVFNTVADEVLILPLAGSCEVATRNESYLLHGRSGVFNSVTDFAYVPLQSDVRLHSPEGGRFAIPGARAARELPFRYCPSESVPVELRGAGSCSRQVVNYCTPESFDADRLIAVEVLTPSGNWSSYPPHKHDEANEQETDLEEIYYFEVAEGPDGPGIGYQRVYGSPAGPIDVLVEVRSGDLVTVPFGWHGPSMAVPGYDLYYLNVMAGPERAWRITDDPSHGWIRETWAGMLVDPRLPLTGPK